MKHITALSICIMLIMSGCLSTPSSLSRTQPTTDSGPLGTPGLGTNENQPITETSAETGENDEELSRQLYLAVQRKEYQNIAALIEAGADPNAPVLGMAFREADGVREEIPLYILPDVLMSERFSFAEKKRILSILQKGNLNINLGGYSGYSVLDSAVHRKMPFDERISFIKLLLENGADPDLPARKIETAGSGEGYILDPLVTRIIGRREYSTAEKARLLRLLGDYNADFNIPDEDGCTPLYRLLSTSMEIDDRFSLTEILLANGADPDIPGIREVYNQTKDITYTETRYPLQAVLKSFHLDKTQQNDLIKVLLQKGADPNVTDKDQYTFFHSLVFRVEFPDYKELITLALKNGADPGRFNKWGGTPLEAVYTSQDKLEERGFKVTEIFKLITDAGRDLSLTNEDGETLLFQAAEERDAETARWLIDHGVSPKQRDKHGNTVLHALFRHGKPVSEELVRLFVRNGADINARGSNGNTALFLAAKLADHYNGLRLLVELGAEINISNENEVTPYGIALQLGNKQNAEYLAAKGGVPYISRYPAGNEAPACRAVLTADTSLLRSLPLKEFTALTARTKDGVPATALHLAVESGDLSIIRILKSRGADWNAADRYKRSPLEYAVLEGRKDIAAELIAAGADPNSKDIHGVSPFSFATILHPDIAELFLDYGFTPADNGPLSCAVWAGNMKLLRTYAEHSQLGGAAAEFAAAYGQVEAVEYLTGIVEHDSMSDEELTEKAKDMREEFRSFEEHAENVLSVPKKTGGIAEKRGEFTWLIEDYSPWSEELSGDRKLSDYPVGVYVPQSYDGSRPYGLLISMIYAKSPYQYPRPEFRKILDKYNIIWLGFDPYNGLFEPFEYNHEKFALAGVYNMCGYYNIDHSRVYLAGFSWGGRLTGEIVPRKPHIFSGGIAIDGCFTTGNRLLPSLEYGRERITMVMATGDFDYNRMETYRGYSTLLTLGYKDCHFLQQPLKGHAIISAENFEKAIQVLDGRVKK